MPDIETVASTSDMIVNGYAFTREDDGRIRALNLNSPTTASVFDSEGNVLETSMDDMELGIVRGYFLNNREFLGTDHAQVFQFTVAGYYLYYTSFCDVECMRVHASDGRLTETGSAKFFVRANGDTELQHRGKLSGREIGIIQKFI